MRPVTLSHTEKGKKVTLTMLRNTSSILYKKNLSSAFIPVASSVLNSNRNQIQLCYQSYKHYSSSSEGAPQKSRHFWPLLALGSLALGITYYNINNTGKRKYFKLGNYHFDNTK